MKILGLTGSIGMGKTTAAIMLEKLGLKICDSDAIVHRLLGPSGAEVEKVEEEFVNVVREGAVDRYQLGRRVFGDDVALKKLEAILHPMVQSRQADFLRLAALQNASIVVLDVPLLFEVGTDQRCDAVVVVTAPRFLQEQRVLWRPGMTLQRFEATLNRQLHDLQKRQRADFIIHTGLGKWHTFRELRQVVNQMLDRPNGLWPPAGRKSWGIYARSSA